MKTWVLTKIYVLTFMVCLSAEPAAGQSTKAAAPHDDPDTIIDRETIESQPLNGRSLQTLIGLTPGLVFTPSNVVTQGQFSVNGQRAFTNNFTVDGVSANFGTTPSQSLYETASGAVPSLSVLGGTNVLAGADAVQQITVQTSNVAPEYGRTPGAQVAIFTRSGTSTFHGSLSEYFRNDALSASDWFAKKNGVAKPPLHQNDFGGVAGGPLWFGRSDGDQRAFFFVSYEGLRAGQGTVSAPEAVPTAFARSQASGFARQVLSTLPLPNQPSPGDPQPDVGALGTMTTMTPLTGTFVGSYSNPSSLNAASVRIDRALTDRVRFFARYNHGTSQLDSRAMFTSAATISHTPALTESTTAAATMSLTARAMNDLRASFSRSQASLIYTSDDFGGAVRPSPSLMLPPFASSATDQGRITIGANPGVLLGVSSLNRHHHLNILDSMTLVFGSHTLKFGFDYRRNESFNVNDGLFRDMVFDDVPAILSGRISTLYIGDFSGALNPINLNVSAFAQDTWRPTDRLTMTYGLRYDVNPAPRAGAAQHLAPAGSQLYQTTYDNVAPRLGISYKLRQDGRPASHDTILRGGIGVFYGLGSELAGSAYNPFVLDSYANVPFSSPLLDAQPSALAPVTTQSNGRIVGFQPGYELPYTLQSNVALDESLGRGGLTVAYIGAWGRRLARLEQLPQANELFLVTNSATSDYNALQVEYRLRLSNGLRVSSAYTFAHSNDIVSDVSIMNPQVPLQQYDAARDRGPSDFDVRHNFNAAVSVGPSSPHGHGASSMLARDWFFNAIARARSATPVNITTGRDLLNAGLPNTSRPNLVTGVPIYIDDSMAPGGQRINPAAFSIPQAGQQGTLGRNALRGLAAWQVDLSVRRSLPLGGREGGDRRSRRVDLGVDIFNVFNHANFANPVSIMSDRNFGVSTAMLGQALGGLSPLYQIGGPLSAQLFCRLSF